MKIFKFLLLYTLSCAALSAQLSEEGVVNPDQVTTEWLTSKGYINADMLKIFKHHKVKTLLEFGVGFSTKHYLESCNKVISVEIVTHGYGPEWVKRFLGLYQEYANWIPIVYFSGFLGDPQFAPYKYFGSEHVYKACSYQVVTHKDYALIDDFYQTELKAFIKSLAKCHRLDAAFVAGNNYLRGDFVQALFGKTPVIWATGTSPRAQGVKEDVYGYGRVVTPEDYEEIFLPTSGSTVWVQKTEKLFPLIQALKE